MSMSMSNDWCGSYEEFDFGPVTELVDEIIEEPELTDDAPVGTYPQSVERFMNSNSSLLRAAASDHRGTSSHANHSLQSMATSLPSMASFLPDTSSQVPTTSSRGNHSLQSMAAFLPDTMQTTSRGSHSFQSMAAFLPESLQTRNSVSSASNQTIESNPPLSKSSSALLQDTSLFRLSDFFQTSLTFPKTSSDPVQSSPDGRSNPSPTSEAISDDDMNAGAPNSTSKIHHGATKNTSNRDYSRADVSMDEASLKGMSSRAAASFANAQSKYFAHSAETYQQHGMASADIEHSQQRKQWEQYHSARLPHPNSHAVPLLHPDDRNALHPDDRNVLHPDDRNLLHRDDRSLMHHDERNPPESAYPSDREQSLPSSAARSGAMLSADASALGRAMDIEAFQQHAAMSADLQAMQNQQREQWEQYHSSGFQDSDILDLPPHHSIFPLKRALKKTFNVLTAPQRKKPSMWSKEEDERLRKAVEIHGSSNWIAVAKFVRTRSNQMCAQRWRKKLDPKIVGAKKGTWTPEEDANLKALVVKHGTKNVKAWKAVEAGMKFSRTRKQCRERWTNFLDPTLNLEPFTEEEDQKLLELVRLNKNWKTIMKEMPGRTQTRLRRRLDKIKKRRMHENFSTR